MKKETWLKLLKKNRAIAVIRTHDIALGIKMAKAVAKGGIRLIEVTWNSEDPAKLVTELKIELKDCVIGVGTILSVSQLEEAIKCGAEFCFSPHCNHELNKIAIAADIPIIPGALSPSEIINAWTSGASSVKVFPIQAMGGTKYIQSLQGPLSEIPLIPTGGVTLENAAEFIEVGAIGVGLAGELFPKALIVQEDWDAIAQRASQLCQKLKSVKIIKPVGFV